MTPVDDDPLERLGSLPVRDVHPQVAAHIRARAHAALAGQSPPPRWRSAAAAIYARALPAAAAGLGATYLLWALLTVASLYR